MMSASENKLISLPPVYLYFSLQVNYLLTAMGTFRISHKK